LPLTATSNDLLSESSFADATVGSDDIGDESALEEGIGVELAETTNFAFNDLSRNSEGRSDSEVSELKGSNLEDVDRGHDDDVWEDEVSALLRGVCLCFETTEKSLATCDDDLSSPEDLSTVDELCNEDLQGTDTEGGGENVGERPRSTSSG
jgi:hypothetical protein